MKYTGILGVPLILFSKTINGKSQEIVLKCFQTMTSSPKENTENKHKTLLSSIQTQEKKYQIISQELLCYSV